MRSTRRLVLKKETLAELDTAELAAIGAGAQTQACPTNYCVQTWQAVCLISRLMYPCITG